MIEFLEPVTIPSIGAWTRGDRVKLDPELEIQLVRSKKAVAVRSHKKVSEPHSGEED